MRHPLRTPAFFSLLVAFLATAMGGCALIDEKQDDCPEEMQMICIVNLESNMDEELGGMLGSLHDRPLRTALEDYLSHVFIDEVHEVDMVFYDQRQRGRMTFSQSEVMDAGQKVFVLRVPASDYRVGGVANVSAVPMVTVKNEAEKSKFSMVQEGAQPFDSHPSGLFSARRSVLVRDDEDQQFQVSFSMANSAAALVLNRDSCDVRSFRVEFEGMADSFRVVDSVYSFDRGIITKADIIDATPYTGSDVDMAAEKDSWSYESYWTRWVKTPLMACGVGFPTRPISTVNANGDARIWTIYIYIGLEDGTVTRSEVLIGRPVRPGQLLIIKGWICADGSFTAIPEHEPWWVGPGIDPKPEEPNPPASDSTVVGVNVTIDWTEGPTYQPNL